MDKKTYIDRLIKEGEALEMGCIALMLAEITYNRYHISKR
jgi:hypothetical protein